MLIKIIGSRELFSNGFLLFSTAGGKREVEDETKRALS
jgi:hypothetical protein